MLFVSFVLWSTLFFCLSLISSSSSSTEYKLCCLFTQTMHVYECWLCFSVVFLLSVFFRFLFITTTKNCSKENKTRQDDEWIFSLLEQPHRTHLWNIWINKCEFMHFVKSIDDDDDAWLTNVKVCVGWL